MPVNKSLPVSEQHEKAISDLLAEGHRLSQHRRFAEAEACARRVLQIKGDHAVAHNNFGFARQMQGDFAGARAAYQRALTFQPGLEMARHNLVMLHARFGDWRTCISLLEPDARTSAGWKWM